MKLTKILIMLTLLSLMMFSCDKEDDDPLVGSWTYASEDDYGTYSSNLTFTSSNVTWTEVEACDSTNPDSFCDDEYDWSCSSTGTWSVDGDQLTLTFPIIEEEDYDSDDCISSAIVVTYNINGNSLSITISSPYPGYDYSYTVVFTRD